MDFIFAGWLAGDKYGFYFSRGETSMGFISAGPAGRRQVWILPFAGGDKY